MRDNIFNTPKKESSPFAFDEAVAGVFDDMISRSVPFYDEVQQATELLAGQFYQPGTQAYDMGCSTGTTLVRLAAALPDDAQIVGVDNSESMLKKCWEKLAALGVSAKVKLLCSDITAIELDQASVVILNYTLQFVEPTKRAAFLGQIHAGMAPGGVLILTEKIRHQVPALEELVVRLYYDFKRRNGYSDLEISQKREALENVLVPFTLEENLQLLTAAGFSRAEVFLKWYNFVSIAAFK